MLDNLDSWRIHLEAERRSPRTIGNYLSAVDLYARWCKDNDRPVEIDLRQAEAWIADMLASGASAGTARVRQAGLRQYSRWLAAEEIIPADPLRDMKPVKLDHKVVEVYTEDDLVALIKTCTGKDFTDRRDEAILRLLTETGLRAHEVLGLTVADVDLREGTVTIHKGKGGSGRRVAIGAKTCRAIDRYLRARRGHRLADSPKLWLGRREDLKYHGLWRMIRRRAAMAGVDGARPHRFRHTFASRWLEKQGGENALMAAGGWSRREMLDRYVRATTQQRAMDEARRLQLGDL